MKKKLSDSFAMNATLDKDLFEKSAWVAYVYIGLGLVTFIFTFLMIVLWEIIGQENANRLRLKFFAHVLRMDLQWHEGLGKTGALNSCLTEGFLKVINNLCSKLGLLISAASSLVTLVIVNFALNWKLGGLITAGTFLTAFCLLAAGKICGKLTAAEQASEREFGFAAHEALTSIKVVKSFNCQSYETARLSRIARTGKAIAIKKFFAVSTHSGVSTFLTYAVFSAGIAYGTDLMTIGDVQPGDFIICLVCVMMGSFAFSSFLPLMSDVVDGVSSCGNLFKHFDSTPEVDQESNEGVSRDNLQGDIIFKDVTFTYPSRKNCKVLDKLNMTIPKGKTTAVVGPSGAGKSSIINLILRLYEPSSGQISIGSDNIRNFNINAFRNKIGIVAQEPILFDGSIEENIRLGSLNATLDQIQSAAKQAHAHEFITSLPKGYQTIVGERGCKLSGGQKQRIAIARALVRSPDVLLFDEATSALDNQSEKLIQKSLEEVCRGRTSVIVAHRLTTIRHADIIFVMENGSVVECGNHEELVSRQGAYFSLYERQKNSENEQLNGILHELPAAEGETISSHNNEIDDKNSSKASRVGMAPKRMNIFKLSNKVLVSLSVVLSITTGLIIPIYCIQFYTPFITEVMALSPPEVLYSLSLNMIIFAIVAGLLVFLQVITTSYSMEISVENLKTSMFRSAIQQEISFFDDVNFTPIKVANILMEKPGQIRDVGGIKAGNALNNFIFVLSSVIVAVVVFWQLGLSELPSLIVVIVSNVFMTRLKFSMQKEANITESNASKLVTSCFDHIPTIYCFSLQKYMTSKYQEIIFARKRQEWKEILMYGTVFSLSNSIQFFHVSIALWWGVEWILEGKNTIDNLFTSNFILLVALGVTGGIVMYYQEAGRAKPGIDEALHLINLHSDMVIAPEISSALAIIGKIDFKNVFFSYPHCSNAVLQGLNLHIESGQTVAIVGRSGSGKSTIVNLLQNFYCPSQGEILIDGQDIRTLGVHRSRNSMGLVTQEPLLFSGTIRYNILYGVQSLGVTVSDTDLVNCCRQANIHEFITSLPQGYDTEVGPRGSRLSGGQRQRIAIARALIRDPRILLLDEATSALDSESEKEVQKALNSARKGRTTIVVAHRLSTVENADSIVVLDNGVVVEQGTHEELIDFKGLYYNMTLH